MPISVSPEELTREDVGASPPPEKGTVISVSPESLTPAVMSVSPDLLSPVQDPSEKGPQGPTEAPQETPTEFTEWVNRPKEGVLKTIGKAAESTYTGFQRGVESLPDLVLNPEKIPLTAAEAVQTGLGWFADPIWKIAEMPSRKLEERELQKKYDEAYWALGEIKDGTRQFATPEERDREIKRLELALKTNDPRWPAYQKYVTEFWTQKRREKGQTQWGDLIASISPELGNIVDENINPDVAFAASFAVPGGGLGAAGKTARGIMGAGARKLFGMAPKVVETGVEAASKLPGVTPSSVAAQGASKIAGGIARGAEKVADVAPKFEQALIDASGKTALAGGVLGGVSAAAAGGDPKDIAMAAGAGALAGKSPAFLLSKAKEAGKWANRVADVARGSESLFDAVQKSIRGGGAVGMSTEKNVLAESIAGTMPKGSIGREALEGGGKASAQAAKAAIGSMDWAGRNIIDPAIHSAAVFGVLNYLQDPTGDSVFEGVGNGLVIGPIGRQLARPTGALLRYRAVPVTEGAKYEKDRIVFNPTGAAFGDTGLFRSVKAGDVSKTGDIIAGKMQGERDQASLAYALRGLSGDASKEAAVETMQKYGMSPFELASAINSKRTGETITPILLRTPSQMLDTPGIPDTPSAGVSSEKVTVGSLTKTAQDALALTQGEIATLGERAAEAERTASADEGVSSIQEGLTSQEANLRKREAYLKKHIEELNGMGGVESSEPVVVVNTTDPAFLQSRSIAHEVYGHAIRMRKLPDDATEEEKNLFRKAQEFLEVYSGKRDARGEFVRNAPDEKDIAEAQARLTQAQDAYNKLGTREALVDRYDAEANLQDAISGRPVNRGLYDRTTREGHARILNDIVSYYVDGLGWSREDVLPIISEISPELKLQEMKVAYENTARSYAQSKKPGAEQRARALEVRKQAIDKLEAQMPALREAADKRVDSFTEEAIASEFDKFAAGARGGLRIGARDALWRQSTLGKAFEFINLRKALERKIGIYEANGYAWDIGPQGFVIRDMATGKPHPVDPNTERLVAEVVLASTRLRNKLLVGSQSGRERVITPKEIRFNKSLANEIKASGMVRTVLKTDDELVEDAKRILGPELSSDPMEQKRQIAAAIADGRIDNSRVLFKPNGDPWFESESRIRQNDAIRAKAIMDALNAVGPISDPTGEYALRKTVDEKGKEYWDGIPNRRQLDALLALPDVVLPANTKSFLRKLYHHMVDSEGRLRPASERGLPMTWLYYAALEKNRYSSGIVQTLRMAAPTSLHISKASNLGQRVIDFTELVTALKDTVNKRPEFFEPWMRNGESLGAAVDAFKNDFQKYIVNHESKVPGATGLDADPALAELKAKHINDFFAITDKEHKVTHPKGYKFEHNIFKMLRLDRTADLGEADSSPLGKKLHITVDLTKQKERFMPAEGSPEEMALKQTIEPELQELFARFKASEAKNQTLWNESGTRGRSVNPAQDGATTRAYKALSRRYSELHPEDRMNQGLINQHIKYNELVAKLRDETRMMPSGEPTEKRQPSPRTEFHREDMRKQIEFLAEKAKADGFTDINSLPIGKLGEYAAAWRAQNPREKFMPSASVGKWTQRQYDQTYFPWGIDPSVPAEAKIRMIEDRIREFNRVRNASGDKLQRGDYSSRDEALKTHAELSEQLRKEKAIRPEDRAILNMGPLRSVDALESYLKKKGEGYMEYDGPEELRESFYEEQSSRLYQFYNVFKDIMESDDPIVTVYRGVRMRDPKNINYDNVGRYWTFDRDSAKQYEGQEGYGDVHVITGEVDRKDIDWIWSARMNARVEAENEATLKAGAKVRVTHLDDAPLKSPRDASVKKIGFEQDTRLMPASKVTPEQDKAYLAAVEKGDTETAQRMVDEAAKAAGYTIGPVFHGGKEFSRFDATKPSVTTGRPAQQAFYFTSSRDNAGFFEDGEIKRGFLRGNFKEAEGTHPPTEIGNVIVENFKNEGDKQWDGVVVRDVLDGSHHSDVYAVIPNENESTSLFKSAEPITRDDTGRVIPLSERFNKESEDIRFMPASEKEPTAEAPKFEKIPEGQMADYYEAKDLERGIPPMSPGSSVGALRFMPSARVEGRLTLGGEVKDIPEMRNADAAVGLQKMLTAEAKILSSMIDPSSPRWKTKDGSSLVEYARNIMQGEGIEDLRKSFEGDRPPSWVKDKKFWNETKSVIESLKKYSGGKLGLDVEEELLAGNRKTGGISLDFGLTTCLPTESCSVCYARFAPGKIASIAGARVRRMIAMSLYPEQSGRAIAEFLKSKDRAEVPFLRVNGAGDITLKWQANLINSIIASADRPLHIFSRSHTPRTEGSAGLTDISNGHYDPAHPELGVAVYKMGSIDRQLVEEYGIPFLRDNLEKRGIVNSYLVQSVEDIPVMLKLRDEGVPFIMHVALNGKVVAALNKAGLLATRENIEKYSTIAAPACVCSIESGPFLNGCASCLIAKSNCFAIGSQLGMTPSGKLMIIDSSDRSANAIEAAKRREGKVIQLSQIGTGKPVEDPKVALGVIGRAYVMAAEDIGKKISKLRGGRMKGFTIEDPRSREPFVAIVGKAEIPKAEGVAANWKAQGQKMIDGAVSDSKALQLIAKDAVKIDPIAGAGRTRDEVNPKLLAEAYKTLDGQKVRVISKGAYKSVVERVEGDHTSRTVVENEALKPWREPKVPKAAESEPAKAEAKLMPADLGSIKIGNMEFVKDKRDSDRPMVLLNAQATDKNWANNAGFYVGPQGKGNGIGKRYANLAEKFNKGGEMDVPLVTIREDGGVEFTDGRHRFALMRDLGMKEIPVTMDEESVKNAQKHGLLSEPKAEGAEDSRLMPVTDRASKARLFEELASEQRGDPENAMSDVTMFHHGVLSGVVENAGDIMHRMNEMASRDLDREDGGWGIQATANKIERTLRNLDSRYGFEKEHEQNIVNNAKYRKTDVGEYRTKLDELLKAYAEEHRKLPFFNRPQELAREATIAIGEQRWGDARKALHELRDLTKDPKVWRDAYWGDTKNPKGSDVKYMPALPDQKSPAGRMVADFHKVSKPTEITTVRDFNGAKVGLIKRGDEILVSMIAVPPDKQGQGLGSKALKAVTDLADKHGVLLSLDPMDFSKTGLLSDQKLAEWYGRHGFTEPGETEKLQRRPKAPEESSVRLMPSSKLDQINERLPKIIAHLSDGATEVNNFSISKDKEPPTATAPMHAWNRLSQFMENHPMAEFERTQQTVKERFAKGSGDLFKVIPPERVWGEFMGWMKPKTPNEVPPPIETTVSPAGMIVKKCLASGKKAEMEFKALMGIFEDARENLAGSDKAAAERIDKAMKAMQELRALRDEVNAGKPVETGAAKIKEGAESKVFLDPKSKGHVLKVIYSPLIVGNIDWIGLIETKDKNLKMIGAPDVLRGTPLDAMLKAGRMNKAPAVAGLEFLGFTDAGFPAFRQELLTFRPNTSQDWRRETLGEGVLSGVMNWHGINDPTIAASQPVLQTPRGSLLAADVRDANVGITKKGKAALADLIVTPFSQADKSAIQSKKDPLMFRPSTVRKALAQVEPYRD